MPFRAMTSDRLCRSHPSERSPRTAWQAGADVVVHICTGDTCATAALAVNSRAPNKRYENLFPHGFMWLILPEHRANEQVAWTIVDLSGISLLALKLGSILHLG